MANSGNWGRGVIGPNIILDGLTVYHDIANSMSYPGTGISINDLTPYQGNIAASLSQVGAGYTYSSTFPQSIRFTSGSGVRASGSFTLPNFDTSFTAIVVASSPTSTWNPSSGLVDSLRGGSLVGGSCSGSLTDSTNGFVLGAFYDTNVSPNRNRLITTLRDTTSQYTYSIDLTDINITKPHIYYVSYNDSTNRIISGYDNVSANSAFPTTRASANLQLYYSWFDRPITGYSSRYLNYNMYLCMIYNRALVQQELTQTYYALKSRFGIS